MWIRVNADHLCQGNHQSDASSCVCAWRPTGRPPTMEGDGLARLPPRAGMDTVQTTLDWNDWSRSWIPALPGLLDYPSVRAGVARAHGGWEGGSRPSTLPGGLGALSAF
ncbi:unnamed protein product [Rangifer tarandus platyrhynchus]|uniref:Uncharacterized protein n=1 Tax=Rangifer tarandus platyrhynchus TaxID=3082113 RepID=A0ABN8XVR8_RANTA|nr:unnamed protein product [Rangifer tarandus platyrhynchus]